MPWRRNPSPARAVRRSGSGAPPAAGRPQAGTVRAIRRRRTGLPGLRSGSDREVAQDRRGQLLVALHLDPVGDRGRPDPAAGQADDTSPSPGRASPPGPATAPRRSCRGRPRPPGPCAGTPPGRAHRRRPRSWPGARVLRDHLGQRVEQAVPGDVGAGRVEVAGLAQRDAQVLLVHPDVERPHPQGLFQGLLRAERGRGPWCRGARFSFRSCRARRMIVYSSSEVISGAVWWRRTSTCISM